MLGRGNYSLTRKSIFRIGRNGDFCQGLSSFGLTDRCSSRCKWQQSLLEEISVDRTRKCYMTYFCSSSCDNRSSIFFIFTKAKENTENNSTIDLQTSPCASYRATCSRQLSLLCLHNCTRTGIIPASTNLFRRSS